MGLLRNQKVGWGVDVDHPDGKLEVRIEEIIVGSSIDRTVRFSVRTPKGAFYKFTTDNYHGPQAVYPGVTVLVGDRRPGLKTRAVMIFDAKSPEGEIYPIFRYGPK